MVGKNFGAYVELHVKKDSAAIAAFNQEIEQAIARAGKIDISKALTAANIDALTLGNEIQQKLDRFNFRIRIYRFDADGAIASLRTQIESMIGGVNIRTGGAGGSGTGGSTAEVSLTRQRDLLTDIVRLQTQAESALNKNILGGTDATGIRLKEIITDLQSLQGQVSTTAQMSEGEITTVNSLFAELRLALAQVSEGIVASGESGDAAAQSYIRQLNLLNQIEQKRRQINHILTNNTNISGTGLETELRQSLNVLDQLEIKISKMPYISQTAKDRFSAQINEVRNNIAGIQTTMVQTGQVGNTMWTRLTAGFKKFGGWMVVTRVLTSIIRLCRQVVTNVKEIDSAMTQLRIVTNASTAEMSKFGATATSAAKRMGASITDLVDSATTYARLGYSLDESNMLAEYTAMLQKVGAIDVSDAQSAVTAITKAFDDINSSNIELAMDKLVKVGNNFPISTAELAEGLNNASSALAAAGNTFDQSLALLTAANATVQDISKASTGLRTITARLRNTTVDLEELGEEMTQPKYEAIVSALTNAGVALRDMNGEYRSTYDIMSDLARKWDDLTSMQKAALATNIAGTRQQNVFYSLIEQFQEASGAMEAMGESAGTLSESYDKYLDSVEGKMAQLSATFQAFSADILSSKAVGTIISITQGLVNVLDVLTKIHLLLPLIIATVTVWRGLSAASAVTKLTSKILIQKNVTEQDLLATQNLTYSQKMLMSQQIALAVEEGILTEEQGEQLLMQLGLNAATVTGTTATMGLAASLKALWTVISSNPLGLILTVVTLLISAVQIVSDKIEEARQAQIQANKDLINTNKALVEQGQQFLNNAKLIQSYLAQSDLTEDQERSFESAVDAVSQALGGKKIALSDAREEQEKYLDTLQQTVEAEKDIAIARARESAKAASDNLSDKYMNADHGQYLSGAGMTFSYQSEWLSDKNAYNRLREVFGDTGFSKTNTYGYNSKSRWQQSIGADKDNVYELLEYYTLLMKLRDQLALDDDMENRVYNIVNENILALHEEAEAAFEAQSALLLLENPPEGSITSRQDYIKYIDDLVASSDLFVDKTPEYINAFKEHLYLLGTEYPDIAVKKTTDATGKIVQSFDELKNVVDELRSGFSTVSSAIKEFNDNGVVSAETLEKLLALKPEYLNLLVDENGQLNLTSESYERLVKAKLQEMLVTQMQAAFDHVLGLDIEAAAAYAAAEAYTTETGTIYDLIKAKMQLALADAATKDSAHNTDMYTKGIQRAAASFAPLVNMIENYTTAAEYATSTTNNNTDALKQQKEALEDAKDALNDYKDELNDAQSSIKDLIDLVSDYLKQQKEDEKKVLEDRKKNFDDLIDKEKEELRIKKEAAEFDKKLREKQNAVAKNALTASIASLDDSAAGKKAQKAANDALTKSRSDLQDTLDDHAYDMRTDALDQLKKQTDKHYDDEIAKIDEYLKDVRKIYEDACYIIDHDTGDLYGKLWRYTYKYTTKTKAEYNKLWSSAQIALQKYNVAQNGTMGIMEILQGEIYDTERQIEGLEDTIKTLSKTIDTMANTSLGNVATQIGNISKAWQDLMKEMANYTPPDTSFKTGTGNKGYEKEEDRNSEDWKRAHNPKVFADDSTDSKLVLHYWYLDYNGRTEKVYGNQATAIKLLLAKYGMDTRAGSFVKKNMYHYASGTLSAYGGPSEVNEDGHEIRILNKGDGILTAKITKNLSNFGANPAQFLVDAGKQLLSQISGSALYQSIFGSKLQQAYGLSSGEITPINIVNNIQGDVNPSTLRELTRIQKQIVQDAVKTTMSKTLAHCIR